MQFACMYAKPIDRDIDKVVKADSTEHLANELEEFVFTPELMRQLGGFFDEYNAPRSTVNGAWISGFFGSGKSHLLKILAVALENRSVAGQPALDYLVPKLQKNPSLAGAFEMAVRSHPSQSILFNIDSEAPNGIRGEGGAMLATFIKVFDRQCGYFDGAQAHIARLERDLDEEGRLQDFEARVEELCGKRWQDIRARATIHAARISQAYDEVCGNAPGTNANIVQSYQRGYKPDIRSFAQDVRAYIQKQPRGFRLNFFVDEVGQFIAKNENLMVNLQTIAEELNTVCGGAAWVIVTSQENMEDTVGEMTAKSANDFSKIRDRFGVSITLTSQDTKTIIQRRLLEKTPQAEVELQELYQRKRGDFKVLFDFQDGSKYFKPYQDEEEFCATYPFVPYQFDLLATVIRGLSEYNAFTGRHNATGARSALGVFQGVAERQAPVRCTEQEDLAPFDLMFEELRGAMRGEMYAQVSIAENQLGQNPMALRVLKALFLVKYCKDFRATPGNLRVLLYDSLEQNTAVLEQDIKDALAELERQVYVRRNGNVYEFLTNEEKDVEREIKNTAVSADELEHAVAELVGDVVGSARVTYKNGGFESVYAYRLCVNGTPRTQNSKAELFVDLVTDPDANRQAIDAVTPKWLCISFGGAQDFVDGLYTYKRTERYINLNGQGAGVRASIIADKRQANMALRTKLRADLEEQLAGASYAVGGVVVQTSGGAAKDVVARAVLELVRRSYPALQQLSEKLMDETAYQTCLGAQTQLGGALPEYAQTVEAQLRIMQAKGVVTVGGEGAQSLAARFAKGEFGWPDAAVRNAVALLCKTGRAEVRRAGVTLEGAALASALKMYKGSEKLTVKTVQAYTPQQVAEVRAAARQVQGTEPAAQDVKGIAAELERYLGGKVNAFEGGRQTAAAYPFGARYAERLDQLDAARTALANDWRWAAGGLLKEGPALQGALEDLVEMRKFSAGSPACTRWQELRDFLAGPAGELAALGLDTPENRELVERARALAKDPDCYRSLELSRLWRRARGLGEEAEAAKDGLRAQAAQELASKLQSFKDDPSFAQAGEQAWRQVEALFADAAQSIGRCDSVYKIKAIPGEFIDREGGRIVGLLQVGVAATTASALKPKPKPEEPDGGQGGQVGKDGQPAQGGQAHGGAGAAAKAERPAPRPAPQPAPQTVRVGELAQKACTWAVLDSPEDVEAYVERLRAALLEELEAGHVIIL